MRLARPFRADWTVDGLAESKRTLVDMTDRAMCATDELARLVAEHHGVFVTVGTAVLDARMRVATAPLHAAGGADRDFVRREDGARIEGAFGSMLVADETTRDVRPSQMGGAVDALIDAAGRAVMLADGLPAGHATRHLVHTNVLAASTLALREALGAEAALAARRRERRECRVLLADRAGADGARLHALAARGMVALGTYRFVSRAVGLVTRQTGACVLGAGRMTIDMTGRDAVVPAKVLVADAAGVGTGVARNVARLAHREPPDARAPAFRTGERPIAGAVEPPLRDEWRTHAAAADELPLRALHEQLPLGELHRMHDRSYLVPALFLGATSRMLGFDRAPVRRVS